MALLPPHFLDCVVAIGYPDGEGDTQWAASGFFYGHLFQTTPDGKKGYGIFLVTNRHVFVDKAVAKVRFNPRPEGPAAEYDLPLLTPE